MKRCVPELAASSRASSFARERDPLYGQGFQKFGVTNAVLPTVELIPGRAGARAAHRSTLRRRNA